MHDWISYKLSSLKVETGVLGIHVVHAQTIKDY